MPAPFPKPGRRPGNEDGMKVESRWNEDGFFAPFHYTQNDKLSVLQARTGRVPIMLPGVP